MHILVYIVLLAALKILFAAYTFVRWHHDALLHHRPEVLVPLLHGQSNPTVEILGATPIIAKRIDSLSCKLAVTFRCQQVLPFPFLPIDCNSVSSSSKSRQFPMLKDFKEILGFGMKPNSYWFPFNVYSSNLDFFVNPCFQSLEFSLIWICIAAMFSKIAESFGDNVCMCGQCEFLVS